MGVFDKLPTDLAIRIARKHDRVTRMEKHVAILVADGFTDSGLSVTLDVLRTANTLAVRSGRSPVFRIDVVSARGDDVRAASGLRIDDETVRGRGRARGRRPGAVDMGGGPAELDAVLERSDIRRFVRAIRSAHARGAIVGAGCSGGVCAGGGRTARRA